jgi:hypothetical protein
MNVILGNRIIADEINCRHMVNWASRAMLPARRTIRRNCGHLTGVIECEKFGQCSGGSQIRDRDAAGKLFGQADGDVG